MIRAGKQYRRRQRPFTVVRVVARHRGMVTYQLKRTVMTISVPAFKEIYERIGRRALDHERTAVRQELGTPTARQVREDVEANKRRAGELRRATRDR